MIYLIIAVILLLIWCIWREIWFQREFYAIRDIAIQIRNTANAMQEVWGWTVGEHADWKYRALSAERERDLLRKELWFITPTKDEDGRTTNPPDGS